MLTSTSSPFFLSILFQIITLKTQPLPASLLIITTLSITNTYKKKKKKNLSAKLILTREYENIYREPATLSHDQSHVSRQYIFFHRSFGNGDVHIVFEDYVACQWHSTKRGGGGGFGGSTCGHGHGHGECVALCFFLSKIKIHETWYLESKVFCRFFL